MNPAIQTCWLLLIVLWACPVPAVRAGSATPRQIDAAIQRAVAYLYAQQENGNWDFPAIPDQLDGPYRPQPHGADRPGHVFAARCGRKCDQRASGAGHQLSPEGKDHRHVCPWDANAGMALPETLTRAAPVEMQDGKAAGRRHGHQGRGRRTLALLAAQRRHL